MAGKHPAAVSESVKFYAEIKPQLAIANVTVGFRLVDKLPGLQVSTFYGLEVVLKLPRTAVSVLTHACTWHGDS